MSALTERRIRYAIIGGMATIQHTRLRSTDDVDVLLTIPQLLMPGFFELLEQRGFTIDLLKNIREFRDQGMTAVRFADVLVDLMQPVIPAYAHVLDRAITTEILGRPVQISSAEGLIVMKLIAMRPQDVTDIRELLAAYGGKLDLGFIRSELDTFTKPDDPRRTQFEAWVRDAITDA